MVENTLIDVLLVDAADGRPFGRSEQPAEQLPERFEAGMVLDLGESAWAVVTAEPADRAGYLAAGQLVLTLAAQQTVDPNEVGFTLPTILAELPPLTPADETAQDLVLHEDDWRQAELVERACWPEVAAELAKIRQVYEQHSRVVGEGEGAVRVFEEIHLRQGPAAPLTGGLTRQRLFELLSVEREYAGVALRNGQGRVAESFAAQAGPVTFYGTSREGRVAVLGLAAVTGESPELEALVREFDLVVVDWCAEPEPSAE
ncbi:hypothetical protein CFP65_0217 [Kitasatospora sp. MMS16-BH015]|uniref:hypothetical protein n=1 Tax=Kitasatospora sp. MMS16-BH015 TaxID=2018025 RepID=UPI000CA3046F|nr:hypothetical protein [Kitasatospora sp. MMS16-BH015]AUG75198.1 hypothetical protein CFP65_0217 [Kitasatospora sp. MMS16-BH015]